MKTRILVATLLLLALRLGAPQPARVTGPMQGMPRVTITQG